MKRHHLPKYFCCFQDRFRFGSENWYKVMMEIFNYNTAPGATIYTILIVAFTFFYAFVQVNPEKLAENLQKQGSYIPSVRPGKGTEEYVSRLLMRLSTVGAVFLGLVALLPIIAQMVWGSLSERSKYHSIKRVQLFLISKHELTPKLF
ncbi:hypothetical protein EfmJHP36_00940 [Enterococcus faecium]|nr:hypothetical protein EfmJHP36_00940 [Enterococcus faecium]